MARLRPFLRPGGRLVLTTPNVANWAIRLSLLGGRWRYTDRGILDRTHVHLFTRKALVETVEAAGYRHPRAGPHRTRPDPRHSDRRARRPRSRTPQAVALRLPVPPRRDAEVISVVIPVKNGGDDLSRCLAGIALQAIDEHVEIVVVDSGSMTTAPTGPARPARSSTRSPPASSGTAARGTSASGSPRESSSSSPRRTPSRPTTPGSRDSRRPPGARPTSPGAYGRQLPHPGARPPERVLPRLHVRPDGAHAEAVRRRRADIRDDALLQRERGDPAGRPRAVPVPRRPDDERGPGVVAARRSGRATRSSTSPARPSTTPTRTPSRTAFRRFFDSGISAEHSYVEGDESKAALRRAGSRYAREELAWLWRTGRRRWIPYTVVYELAKFTGLQLGLRHDRLPRSLVSRLSGLPPRGTDMPAE